MKKSIKMSLLIFICLLFAMLVFAQSVPRQSHSASEIEAGVLQGDYSITGKLGIGTNNLRTPLTVVVPGAIYPGASNSRATMSLARNSNNYLLMETPGETTAGFGLAGTKFIIATDREDIEFKTGISFSENWNSTGISRMVIDSSGNVGIGTASPGNKLDVNGAISVLGTNAVVGANRATIDIIPASGFMRILSLGPNSLTRGGIRLTQTTSDGTQSLESVVVVPAGDVGIGVSPKAPLHVENRATTTGDAEVLRLTATTPTVAPYISIGDPGPSYLTGGVINWNPNTNALGLGVHSEPIAVTIKPGGNVGIGTTSPQQKLHLYAPNTDALRLYINNNNAGFYAGINPSGIVETGSTNPVDYALITGGVEKVRITSSGNVGIGTTGPSALLDVAGVIKLSASGTLPTDEANTIRGVTSGNLEFRGGSTGYNFLNTDNTASLVTILNGGNVGIGTTNPTQKLHVKSVMMLEPTDSPGSCNSALKGSIYYDNSLNEPCYCDSTLWKQFDGGGNC